MSFDPLKAYKTPLTGEAKKKYYKNWERIFGKKKKPKLDINKS